MDWDALEDVVRAAGREMIEESNTMPERHAHEATKAYLLRIITKVRAAKLTGEPTGKGG